MYSMLLRMGSSLSQSRAVYIVFLNFPTFPTGKVTFPGIPGSRDWLLSSTKVKVLSTCMMLRVINCPGCHDVDRGNIPSLGSASFKKFS